MKETGLHHVYVVPEQELPDGEFPTVSYPNPEAAEAFALDLKLAKEKDATWFWLPIRMQTVWAYTLRTPSQVSTSPDRQHVRFPSVRVRAEPEKAAGKIPAERAGQ